MAKGRRWARSRRVYVRSRLDRRWARRLGPAHSLGFFYFIFFSFRTCTVARSFGTNGRVIEYITGHEASVETQVQTTLYTVYSLYTAPVTTHEHGAVATYFRLSVPRPRKHCDTDEESGEASQFGCIVPYRDAAHQSQWHRSVHVTPPSGARASRGPRPHTTHRHTGRELDT